MKKKIGISIVAFVAITILVSCYFLFVSPTKVGLVNYPEFMSTKIMRSCESSFIDVEILEQENISDAKQYDVLLVFGMGLKLTEPQEAIVKEAGTNGTAVYLQATTNKELKLTTLVGDTLSTVKEYLDNSGKNNYRNFLLYARHSIDGKSAFTPKPEAPKEIASDVLFYKDDEVAFEKIEEFESYCLENGFHKKGNKKAILFTSIPGPFNSNREHMVSMIEEMESRNVNLYPVSGFMARLDYMKSIQPDLIIYMPHGRLSMGGSSDAIAKELKKLNVPVLCPITVHMRYDEWLKDKQGMVGGLLSQSVTMPEFDGGIAPYAVFAQYEDEKGYLIFKAIENRLKKFGEMTEKYLYLQEAPNKDKKIAIVYLKGPGKNALEAADMEVLPSLHNLLLRMKKQGYNTGNLPSSFEAFKMRVMTEGPVLGVYAEGAFDHYLETGNPELITVNDYNKWSKEILPQDLIDQTNKRYGKAPGSYMAVYKNKTEHIAVSRVQFGNVVLLPQPLPGLGNDQFALVHGAKVAPPHTYIAPYLWIQKGFDADAIIHFGTHGSLEFTPGKQIALSDYDWTDPLIGPTPHNYIYTIGNVGEAMIAKRRSYAAVQTHLTSPFMEAEALGSQQLLKQKINSYTQAKGSLKRQYALSVKDLFVKAGYHKDLELDDELTTPYTDEEMLRVTGYLEELTNEKVTAGLYTMGQVYNPKQLDETSLLMHYDALAYSMMEVDYQNKQITKEQYKDPNYLATHYIASAKKFTKQIIASESENRVRSQIIPPTLLAKADAWSSAKEKEKAESRKRMMAMMKAAMAKKSDSKKVDKSSAMEQHAMSKSKEESGHPKTMPKAMMEAMAKKKEANDSVDGHTGATASSDSPGAKKPADDHHHKSSAMDMAMAKPDKSMMAAMMKKKGDKKSTDAHSAASPSSHPSETKKSAHGSHGESSGMMGMGSMAKANSKEDILMQSVVTLNNTINSILVKREELAISPNAEFESILNALNGRFTAPSPGGDPVANPESVPTGRNLYSINAEQTPTKEAWKVAQKLTEGLFEDFKKKHNGKYPEKISFTLWGGSFIESEGTTIAQILYMLGVEPIWTARGKVNDIRLIPQEELGRPRIDVVVQTSGQLRDLAASRLFVINRAIEMAAQAASEEGQNFVAKGTLDAEKLLIEKGFSPKEARAFATKRVFGNSNGGYGTGIMGMVENSDRWDSTSTVAKTYINNMGSVYGDEESWGTLSQGLFEAALLNTEAVVQPRQSNSWGALSLDHVYEFMGGINLAVKEVTGNDAESYFNDFRNASNPRVQGLKEAVGVESRTTILNPKYIKEYMKGGASSAATFAETFRNTFGWEVMKPTIVEDQLWNDLFDVYVEDKLNLNVQEFFEKENPYALQEMTAVMLETARKGYWEASEEQVKAMSELHAQLVKDHKAGCSGFVCDNAKLKEFIADNLKQESKQAYEKEIKEVRESSAKSSEDNVVLKKEEEKVQQQPNQIPSLAANYKVMGIAGLAFLAFLIVFIRRRRK